jgi:hypothetical protein
VQALVFVPVRLSLVHVSVCVIRAVRDGLLLYFFQEGPGGKVIGDSRTGVRESGIGTSGTGREIGRGYVRRT